MTDKPARKQLCVLTQGTMSLAIWVEHSYAGARLSVELPAAASDVTRQQARLLTPLELEDAVAVLTRASKLVADFYQTEREENAGHGSEE